MGEIFLKQNLLGEWDGMKGRLRTAPAKHHWTTTLRLRSPTSCWVSVCLWNPSGLCSCIEMDLLRNNWCFFPPWKCVKITFLNGISDRFISPKQLNEQCLYLSLCLSASVRQPWKWLYISAAVPPRTAWCPVGNYRHPCSPMLPFLPLFLL